MSSNNNLKTFIFIVLIVFIFISGVIYAKGKDGQNADKQSSASNTTEEANTNTEPNNPIVSTNPPRETDIILFYGSTCPHCKKVEEYIESNKITDYIQFQNLEVYRDKANATLMMEKQAQCADLTENDKGSVPFLYSSKVCVVGDQPIIDFLKKEVER